MGRCKLCGESAGVLHNVHKECEKKQKEADRSIWELALESAITPDDLPSVHAEIDRLASSCWVADARLNQLLVAAWERGVESALEDSVLSEEEEARLAQYIDEFGLSQDELNQHFWYQRVVVAADLRDLDDGIFPSRVRISGRLPFNLQSSERLAWVFPAIAYEERTKTQYVGGSSGVNVRIARGVYYRTSGFKGHPVATSYMYHLGDGSLGLTDKHIYFHSEARSLRISYKKVVSFVPHDDGIGIHRDSASAKPIVFVTGDGWSVFNLAAKLSSLA